VKVTADKHKRGVRLRFSGELARDRGGALVCDLDADEARILADQLLYMVREHGPADLTGRTFGPFLVAGFERSGPNSPWWKLRCRACQSTTYRQACHVRSSLAGRRGAVCTACGAKTPHKRKVKITQALVERLAQGLEDP
jgi:hypothetical protein